MSEHEIVSAAQAEIVALTEALRASCAARDALRTENAALRADNAKLLAILVQHNINTADEATEPQDEAPHA